jgi:alpha-maltose-1-phosphate synthase
MKILLLVQDWISFYNQAEALECGLKQLEIDYRIVLISNKEEKEKIYKEYKPDIAVGIGAWDKYHEFVEEPLSKGVKVLPWIVSDDVVEDYIDGYNKLNLILTTSGYCKKIFVRDGINEEKVKILFEAVDPDFWKKNVDIEEEKRFLNMLSMRSSFKIEQKYNLTEIKNKGIPIILTMGGDVTSKGAQEILGALAKLDKKLEWIYIMKAWPQAHTFKRGQEEFQLIKDFGLENKVRYMVTDFSKEFVRDLMNICDIYAAPSRGEGFGLPLVQAEMCEKPIISINGLSITDVVIDKKTALLAEPTYEDGILKANINGLAKNLEKLITDEKLRKSMGKAGRCFAKKRFEPKSIAKNLMNYIDLIK